MLYEKEDNPIFKLRFSEMGKKVVNLTSSSKLEMARKYVIKLQLGFHTEKNFEGNLFLYLSLGRLSTVKILMCLKCVYVKPPQKRVDGKSEILDC